MRRAARLLSMSCLLMACALLAANVLASDPSVASRLDARGIKYVLDEDGDYKVTYHYSREGRTQLVFVSGGTETIGGLQIREVFSPAAFVEQDGIDGAKALELLADSGSNKLGSWEIRGEVLYYVIKLFDGMDAAQLEAAMEVAAEIADNMEITFSGDRDDL
jgi:hypothetical protein